LKQPRILTPPSVRTRCASVARPPPVGRAPRRVCRHASQRRPHSRRTARAARVSRRHRRPHVRRLPRRVTGGRANVAGRTTRPSGRAAGQQAWPSQIPLGGDDTGPAAWWGDPPRFGPENVWPIVWAGARRGPLVSGARCHPGCRLGRAPSCLSRASHPPARPAWFIVPSPFPRRSARWAPPRRVPPPRALLVNRGRTQTQFVLWKGVVGRSHIVGFWSTLWVWTTKVCFNVCGQSYSR